MRLWHQANIGLKFILVTFPVLMLVMMAFAWYLVEEEKRVFREQLDNLGATITQATASFSIEPLLVKDYPSLNTYTENLVKGTKDIGFIYIERADGVVVAQSNVDARLKQAPFMYERNITILPQHGKKIGKVVLALSPFSMNKAINTRIFSIAVTTTVLFAAFAITVIVLIRVVVSKPLQKLGDSAEAFGAGKLDMPIEVSGSDDEVGRLEIVLEAMRFNLNRSYGTIREQNIQLQELDRLKDEFLAGVTHELKTPLNAIIGYSELARDEISEESLVQVKEDLLKIENSGKKLLNIVNNILTLSDVNASNPEPYSIMSLVDQIRESFWSKAEDNGNKMLVQFHHAQDDVLVDIGKFKQILLQLLDNANKFTHSGIIRIEVFDEMFDDKHWVTMCVSDNGIGIEPKNLDVIFQPFQQSEPTYTRCYGGTGLGLAVCIKVCALLGGSMSVNSEKGVGSSFHVKLPLPTVVLPASKCRLDTSGKLA